MLTLVKRRGLATATRKQNKYKPANRIDAACYHWLGIPAASASQIIAIGIAVGAMMETFMVKVWIGNTNCALTAWHHCTMRALTRTCLRAPS